MPFQVTSPAGVNLRDPTSSKKRKLSGSFTDQTIGQLNDVTEVSGIDLKEEEEKLFSGAAEDIRLSEASSRVLREEEERLILHRTSLQKRLAKNMVECGLKSIGNDVERCLSLCVEERLRGLVCDFIRLSNKRVETEKPRHQAVITSDVGQQIAMINKKVREELERKQAEEKLQKVDEPGAGGDSAADGNKEKDVVRVKPLKTNKEEVDKVRAAATNVAARAAIGGDDLLSKWQHMAEQARKKRKGMIDTASGRKLKDSQEAEKKGSFSHAGPGDSKTFRGNQGTTQTGVARSISIKDVIAALEREPQMCKSVLLYRLYERI